MVSEQRTENTEPFVYRHDRIGSRLQGVQRAIKIIDIKADIIDTVFKLYGSSNVLGLLVEENDCGLEMICLMRSTLDGTLCECIYQKCRSYEVNYGISCYISFVNKGELSKMETDSGKTQRQALSRPHRAGPAAGRSKKRPGRT